MRRGPSPDSRPPAASARRPCSAALAAGVPGAMLRSAGCRVWDADGREYLDLVMALGAVALGYGHPAVTDAAATRGRRRRGRAAPARARGGAGRRNSAAHPLGRAGPFSQDRRGGDGRRGPARAHGHRPRAGAGLRLSRLARLVPDAGGRGRTRGHARALRRAPLQRSRAHPRADPAAGDALAAVVFEPVILAASPTASGSPCFGRRRAGSARC